MTEILRIVVLPSSKRKGILASIPTRWPAGSLNATRCSNSFPSVLLGLQPHSQRGPPQRHDGALLLGWRSLTLWNVHFEILKKADQRDIVVLVDYYLLAGREEQKPRQSEESSPDASSHRF